MTQRSVRLASSDFPDIESINHYRTAVARGESPPAVLDGSPDEPGQRPHAVAVGCRAQAGFTTGTPWMAVNPTIAT